MFITLFVTLFLAGVLTILLPCILPLVPIVLGVSIAGRSKLRPLIMVVGMVLSFVGFSFLLLVVLNQFVQVADYIRIATYYVLLLFGLGFLTEDRRVLNSGAVIGAIFFITKGWVGVGVAAIFGVIAMEIGGRVATALQQFGSDVQIKARGEFGESAITTFIIGMTMGLVWVPCAGPALGFALTLVRNEPGLRAAILLSAYAVGAGVPLLLVGYGGQYAVRSVRALVAYTGLVKKVAGALLILSAVAFQYGWILTLQTWLVQNTSFGTLGTRIEEQFFDPGMFEASSKVNKNDEEDKKDQKDQKDNGSLVSSSPSPSMTLPKLPKLIRAPEFTGLGPWHNSEPMTMALLRGKVVLVDFWTYSCINCIRTLPYIQGYWDKFKGTGKFALIGVHTPEFVFEKDPGNVADALKRHHLTYPVAQDNDYGTWEAFSNRFWPAKYLIDADGTIRYTHFGEGNYEETDLAIQSLLQEIGVSANGERLAVSGRQGNREVTPETYLGSRSWQAFGNAKGNPSEATLTYSAPSSMELHKYYLVGDWQLVNDERQVLRSDEGEIRIRALGSEINLVLGLEPNATPVKADIEVDGQKSQSITIDRHDLFNLFKGEYGEHDIILKIHGKGVEGYAFTFGS